MKREWSYTQTNTDLHTAETKRKQNTQNNERLRESKKNTNCGIYWEKCLQRFESDNDIEHKTNKQNRTEQEKKTTI